MAKSSVNIGIEIEPIVKLTCWNEPCIYRHKESLTCNLKHVELSSSGDCRSKSYPLIHKEQDHG